jgi:predicted O-methyltransferase YrrM
MSTGKTLGEQSRQAVRRLARALAARSAGDTVAAGDPGPEPSRLAPLVPEDHFEVIPRGRSERFHTLEYDVLPRGRFDIVRHDYYSPLPDLASLPPDIWARRSELPSLGIDLEHAACFIEQDLAPYIEELDLPRERVEERGVFYLDNLNYERVDAELLYAMVRHAKPQRIIELGSGFSTLLIGQACERNRADGHQCTYVAYDPDPRPAILGEHPRGLDRLERAPATQVSLEDFGQLGPSDLLFVDTTHTVKLGSDVNYLILEVLPRLRPGVLVHFHDIFLPYEYPRVWFEESGYFWAEQYLLQAFLAFNREFRVLIPAQALARELPKRLSHVVPSFCAGVSPAAFWMVRATPESDPQISASQR